jgi:hypothetical protein
VLRTIMARRPNTTPVGNTKRQPIMRTLPPAMRTMLGITPKKLAKRIWKSTGKNSNH